MAQVLVRDLDEATVETLKALAQANNRSLQGEIKAILDNAAHYATAMSRARREAAAFRAQFKGRVFSDSSEIIRADRDGGHGGDH